MYMQSSSAFQTQSHAPLPAQNDAHGLDEQLGAQFGEECSALDTLIASLAITAPGQAASQLQSQIKLRSKTLRHLFQQIKEDAEEQARNDESEEALLGLSKYQAEINRLQQTIRRATLLMQKNVEETFREERRSLLGCANPAELQRKIVTEAQLAESSENITSSLQRTKQLMAQELDHTSATLAAMDVSEATLKGAHDEFKGQRGHHKRSHKLLGTMKRHSLLDTLTLWGGFAIFLLTVAYVLGKRSYYFVPQFAKDIALSPFRSRNTTAAAPLVAKNSSLQQRRNDSAAAKFTDAELKHELDLSAIDSPASDLTQSTDAEQGLDLSNLNKTDSKQTDQTQPANLTGSDSSQNNLSEHESQAVNPKQTNLSSTEAPVNNSSALDTAAKVDKTSVNLDQNGASSSEELLSEKEDRLVEGSTETEASKEPSQPSEDESSAEKPSEALEQTTGASESEAKEPESTSAAASQTEQAVDESSQEEALITGSVNTAEGEVSAEGDTESREASDREEGETSHAGANEENSATAVGDQLDADSKPGPDVADDHTAESDKDEPERPQSESADATTGQGTEEKLGKSDSPESASTTVQENNVALSDAEEKHTEKPTPEAEVDGASEESSVKTAPGVSEAIEELIQAASAADEAAERQQQEAYPTEYQDTATQGFNSGFVQNETKQSEASNNPVEDQDNQQQPPPSEILGDSSKSPDAEMQASPDARQRHTKWEKTRTRQGAEDEAAPPTTRQEDTEIGVFRPDEL